MRGLSCVPRHHSFGFHLDAKRYSCRAIFSAQFKLAILSLQWARRPLQSSLSGEQTTSRVTTRRLKQSRHGSRLDSANKQWHLTSPIPYDPPLSYGGWMQCQALGLRIANVLSAQEEDESKKGAGHTNSDSASPEETRMRKRKVIIHSSPFTRCVQTSVAISAGLGQYRKRPTVQCAHRHPSPAKATEKDGSHDHHTNDHPGRHHHPVPEKEASLVPTKLRVDAFLGEWLSPDYFENITPPPSSTTMVANAKAELMRPSEEIRGADSSSQSGGRLSTGWLRDPSEPAVVGPAMPLRTRAATFSTERKSHARLGIPGAIHEEDFFYVPPMPNYAISPSDPIPVGFVAHARDACVEIDYQWDSMQGPHDWGDGGEFGEEWSSMHRRFRNGLLKMLAWYQEEETFGDEELVLVIVTHGAGCNALIGALTSAPVLLDVGVASLTLAVRKEQTEVSNTSPFRRRNSLDLGIADRYDMKIIASVEHLRSNPNPLGLNSPRLGRSPAFSSRKMVGPDSFEGFTLGDPLSMRPSSSSSGDRRNLTQTATPSGLWSGRQSRDDTDSSESESFPNFDNTGQGRRTNSTNSRSVIQNSRLPARTLSQKGLWGSDEWADQTGDGVKRRWTTMDRR